MSKNVPVTVLCKRLMAIEERIKTVNSLLGNIDMMQTSYWRSECEADIEKASDELKLQLSEIKRLAESAYNEASQ
jgi:hypothetical protein